MLIVAAHPLCARSCATNRAGCDGCATRKRLRLVLRAAQSGSCAHGRWACGLHAVRCVVGAGRGACGFFKRRLSPQIVSNIKQASFAGFAVAYASALACAYVSAGIIRGRHGEFSHAPESRRWLHTQASMCARKQACALDPGPGDPPRRCCPLNGGQQPSARARSCLGLLPRRGSARRKPNPKAHNDLSIIPKMFSVSAVAAGACQRRCSEELIPVQL